MTVDAPTGRAWMFAAMLLAIGITVAAIGVAGVAHEIAAAASPFWPSSPVAHPVEVIWRLRTCLAIRPCREAGAKLLSAAIAARTSVLWGGILMIATAVLLAGLFRLRSARSDGSTGGARFASGAELRRLARRSPEVWFPLGYARRCPLLLRSRRAPALISPLLTAWAQPVRLPKEDLARHVLVTGLTGAHKTTSVTLPVLLEAARAGVTVIGFDLKYGERDSLAAAAPEWWRRGRQVFVFASLDAASLRWNPLASCRSFGDAHEFAAQLCPDAAAQAADVTYWTGAERGACAALVWALVTDGGGRSLARLRALAEAGPAAVSTYVRRHPRSAEIAPHLGAYGAMLPKDQAGILQGIAARLEALTDERAARATGPSANGSGSWDEIVLERLRREPTLLLVGVRQAELPRLKTLAQLLMRTLAALMLRPRERDETVPVVYLLEELPAWGALPGLADHLATFRSRDVAIVATIQSEAQGQAVYGTAGWAAIAANFVTKVYFPSLADPDAERLSRALGITVTEQISRSRGWAAGGRHDGEQRRMVEVPLRRAEALQGLDGSKDDIILRCPGLAPARLWCPPFHERPECVDLVREIPPSTVEIAVHRRMLYGEVKMYPPAGGGAGRGPAAAAVRSPKPPSLPHEALDSNDWAEAPLALDGAPTLEVTGADGTALVAFMRAVLNRFTEEAVDTRPYRNGAGARVVCRGGRLTEIRLDPATAYRLLGNGETAHAIVRRWAARRWVRQVRPAFVLERRALEALDEDLQRRLLGLASPQQPRAGSAMISR